MKIQSVFFRGKDLFFFDADQVNEPSGVLILHN